MDIQGTYIPDEIFTEIFEYFAMEDRRNVRLVCRKWYDICNQEKFLDKEIFYCVNYLRKYKKHNDFLHSLENSKRNFLQLKFCQTVFTAEDMSFWNNQGSKIRALYLKDCIWEDNILTDIITKSENLHHLTWNYGFERRGSESWKSAIAYFAKNNMQKLEVKSLDFGNFAVEWLTKDFIQEMLYVFPNIERFRFELLDLHIECIEYDLKDLFAAIGNELSKLQDQLIEFHISNTYCNGIMPPKQLINLKRLEKLNVNLYYPRPDYEWFRNGLLQLKSLNSLEISIVDKEWQSTGFLTSLIKCLPRLRHLKYDCLDFMLSEEIFHYFLHSQLVTLSLGANANDLQCDEFTILTDTSPRNHTLRKLVFTSELESNILQLFTKYFVSLEHLILRYFTYIQEDDHIYELSLHRTKLKSLEHANINLNNTKWKEVQNNVNSQRNLTFKYEKLEALPLNLCGAETTYVKDTILDRFEFPKLKFLAVESMFEEMNDDILGVIANFSNLQILTTHSGTFSFEAISEMCSKLKQLRQLHIPVEELDEEKSKQLFQICISLEVFIHLNKCKIYIKDKMNNINITSLWDVPTRFHSIVKVGSHTFQSLAPIQGYWKTYF